jgi:enoyl-CoA hydratase/carnithine racemase
MTDVVLYKELDTVSDKKIGVATLNAQASLNALSLDMVNSLLPKLVQWQSDPDIAMVVLEGAGEKAFCAGGDIRDLYAAMIEKPGEQAEYVERFFTLEYQLDYLIHTFEKPFLVWGQGFVMGGGLGMMAGASHRVVTETSRIAMPEITIGLYPDVGGTYFLNRMPKGCGLFLGMTGASINAADAKYINLADFFVAQDKKYAFYEELLVTKWGGTTSLNHQKLNDVLRKYESDTLNVMPLGNVKSHQEMIEAATDRDSVQNIVASILDIQSDEKWLSKAQKSLRHGSAITAHIVHRQLQMGKDMTLADCFRLELGVSVKCATTGEFAEGVRALLIEKDNKPKWLFKTVQDVDPQVIENIFESPWTAKNHPLKTLGK